MEFNLKCTPSAVSSLIQIHGIQLQFRVLIYVMKNVHSWGLSWFAVFYLPNQIVLLFFFQLRFSNCGMSVYRDEFLTLCSFTLCSCTKKKKIINKITFLSSRMCVWCVLFTSYICLLTLLWGFLQVLKMKLFNEVVFYLGLRMIVSLTLGCTSVMMVISKNLK